jgi:hypothetical protein
MKIKRSIYFIFFFLLVIQTGFSQALDEGTKAAFESINPMNPYDYCKTLSSSRFGGRLTGHEGYTAAANWAAEQFKKWGLKPIDPKTRYLQPYPSPYVIVDKAEMVLLFKDGKRIPLKPEKDFLPMLYSDSGSNKAPVVFAGWGIHAPELGYDDYQGLDVKGKFILCFRGVPDGENPKFTDYDQHRHRMKTAKDMGSIGLIYIAPDPQSNPNGDWIKDFTPAIISYDMADKILEEKGLTSAALQKELLSDKKPRSFTINNSEIEYSVRSGHFPDGVGYNIAGYVEGSDPVLKKECMMIGGHFDHNGTHMGIIFPGANDNASGSAVVMEIARAFSLVKTPPRRSILFVLFGGEEMGLTGSHYFAEHLPTPFTKVFSMFNFDMVGEGDGAACGLNREPPLLEQALKKADEFVHTLGNIHYIKSVGVRSSDYAPFFLKGASCISFFSNGPHVFYHKSGDTIYRINPDVMADIARLAFLTTYFTDSLSH